MSRRLGVLGVGINDSSYETQKFKIIDGKRKRVFACPFYEKWTHMLKRCYSPKSLEKRPSYIDCYVCEEWLLFSNFKAWMEGQDWQGKQLDKDILVEGNKVYSPSTCVFVDKLTNGFINDHKAGRGKYLLGVSIRASGSYMATCSQLNGKNKNLGSFKSEQEAHLAWKRNKMKLAKILSERQSDSRVSEAILLRFS